MNRASGTCGKMSSGLTRMYWRQGWTGKREDRKLCEGLTTAFSTNFLESMSLEPRRLMNPKWHEYTPIILVSRCRKLKVKEQPPPRLVAHRAIPAGRTQTCHQRSNQMYSKEGCMSEW